MLKQKMSVRMSTRWVVKSLSTSGLSGKAAGLWGLLPMLVCAQLPTGVTLVPFYDTDQVSFARDSVRTVGLAERPDKPQHFFVADQMGRVHWLYPDTTRAYTPGQMKDYSKGVVLDIRDQVKKNLRSEMGLWSLAFSPDFRRNRAFYILYFGYNTEPSDAIRSDGYVNLERWILEQDDKRAIRDTTVFRFYHAASYGVSSMAFGPDGYLYIATSVYSEDGWDTTSLARKILRIDVENPGDGKPYSIPPDNPFANSSSPDVKKEIYAWGFRNVWSLSFDFRTGKLWAGDVGQTKAEEINLVEPGRNYGWANGGNSEPTSNGYGVEGKCPSNFSAKGLTCGDLADPEWDFPHTGSKAINCIVVGPAFRGSPASPFYGYHFVTDVQRNQFWAVKEGSSPVLVGQSPTSITSNRDGHNGIVHIAEDAYGNLYASLVSWYFNDPIGGMVNTLPSGQKMFYEIYRLSHPEMTPAPVAVASRGRGLPEFPATRRLVMHAGKGTWVRIPGEYSGFAIFSPQGRRLGTVRGSGEARIPAGVETGILQLQYLP